MSDSSSRDAVEILAEEFVERHRRGERPPLTEYTDRLPNRADEIRALFPALVVMENLKPASDQTTGCDANGGSSARPPERLGDYRILREVARGGMGVVYEAEQVSLGRHVALKVLPSQALINQTYLERFRREAKAAARLHHTNIVPVFGVGEASGVHYYAMQFIRGEGLDRILRDVRRLRERSGALAMPTESGSGVSRSVAQSLLDGSFAGPAAVLVGETSAVMSPSGSIALGGSSISGFSSTGRSDSEYYRSVARIGMQVAEALAYAHRQGVLHRDVKPSNLLLDQQGIAWITDFGLAKAEGADELTNAGDIVGTVRFMAPERFDGQSLPESDIYSLGITLYEMLALRPAFDASHRAKLIEQVLHDAPAPLPSVDRRVPRDLDTIIRKCLAKEPHDRYATADALSDDLRRFLADRPIHARRATWPELIMRWRRRNPALAAALVAVFVLLITVAVGSTVATIWLRSALGASEKNRNLADEARHKADLQRWEATFEQAKANRLSRRPGQRIKTMEILGRCAAEAKSLNLPVERLTELRNAVIATLAMPDLYLEEVTNFHADQRPDFDGNLEQVALVDAKGDCSIRRAADDSQLGHIPGRGVTTSPVYSHGGKYLALIGDDGILQLWERDRASWQCRLTVAKVANVAFRCDDRDVAFCYRDGSLDVYQLNTMSRHYHLAPDTIGNGLKVALHPTEPLAICTSYAGHVAQVRDLRSGHVLTSLAGVNRPSNPVWHPDGIRCVICAGEGGKIHELRWDAKSGTLKEQRVFVTSAGGLQAAFNKQGDRLAVVGWNGIVYLFDFATGQLLFQGPSTWRYSLLRFDVSGTRLAGAVLRQGGKLGIWHVGDGREYQTLVHNQPSGPAGVVSAAVHPNGRLLAAGIQNAGMGLWDLPTGRQLAFLPQADVKAVHVAFDQSGTLYMTSWAGSFRLPVRTAAGAPDRLSVGPPERLPFGRGHSELAVSCDGRIIAKGYGYGYGEAPYAGAWVQFTDQSAPPVHIAKVSSAGNVSISYDNRWLAIGQHFASIHICEVKDGGELKMVRELRGAASFCRFSPDSDWLWGAVDGGKLFQTGSWAPGPACEGIACAFSPHGNLLATTTTAGFVILYDWRTGKELARLEDPNLDFSDTPAFSPDGTKLITVSDANSKGLHVWDLRRIRSVLADLDLDWDGPVFPQADPTLPLREVEFVRPDLARLPQNWDPGAQKADWTRWQGQVAAYSLALGFQPFHPESYLRQGYALHKLKRDGEAVADFDRALALRANHLETLHLRAHAFEQLSQWDRAAADFTAALAVKPNDTHFLDRRGRCRLQLGDFDAGIADLERSLELNPQQPDLKKFLARQYNNRAWRLLIGPAAERDPLRALRLSEMAVNADPEEQHFVNTLGVAQFRLGRYQDASASLQKSLSMGTGVNAAFDLYFLSMCSAEMRDRDKAQEWFDRAVRAHEDNRGRLSKTQQDDLNQIRVESEAALRALANKSDK
jgi:serine/threonine protein kinase/WD40 repeat protein/tetratricopeptide (TPR) repeat protein